MNSSEILAYFSIIYKGDWETIFSALQNKEKIEDENEVHNLIKNIGSKYVTILDDDYPDFLKSIYRPPFVLFYHGDISLLDNKFKSIAVVGSRECSEYGAQWTNELVKDLCKELVIISGMARGIDAVAHWSAIKNGGKTIAVLGTGINNPFPLENRDLYEEIKKNHLIISEYYDKMPGSIFSFPKRNRIVAGLTNVCLLTDGLLKSGSSITAGLVLANGGYVCCIPHPLGKESLCNHLINEGACLVTNAKEIFEEMNYKLYNPIFK